MVFSTIKLKHHLITTRSLFHVISGKSTLVQALFRILEAENGQILIDGVDISQLGLHKLRKGMSVINQYPVLFSGCTVRENLDPFGAFSEEQVIDALTDVQMIQAVSALPYGIDSQVADGGTNFSVGERQLLCLARAMLQKSKILVLDEPTANVDGRTDKLLQEAVNKSFHGATIISVAHRLDTIIENDLILVLGGGKVLEYGSPSELISLNGHFSSMVNDTGAEMSSALKRRAMRNHK
jgi:ABC-type multidrug transport system fused ATPase/permease subunit